MAALIQIVGLVAVSAGAATIAFAFLGVLAAIGVLVLGLGWVAYLIGAALDEEGEDE